MAQQPPIAIKIDLGTMFSCVGVWRGDQVEIIPNDQGNLATPTCVAFTDEACLIGDAAQDQMACNPVNTIFYAKRLIGCKFRDPSIQDDMAAWPLTVTAGLGGVPEICVQHLRECKRVGAEEALAMVLRKMKDTAQSRLAGKGEVKQAVMTVPTYFNHHQRRAALAACDIAGLEVRRLMSESSAAALAYCAQNQGKFAAGERNVLIFDLGAGSLSVSLATIEGGIVEIKSTAGDNHLGGQDFDSCLMAHVQQKMEQQLQTDISGNPAALHRLRTACEQAKIALSNAALTSIKLPSLAEGFDFDCLVARCELEKLCMPLFTKCMEPVQKCLRDARFARNDVHDVVLVGGSSRIPMVRQLLQECLGGKELCMLMNPDEAVAYGAAVQAALLSGSSSPELQDLFLLDVAPFSLGIETYGGIMATLAARNTTIPIKKERHFSVPRVDCAGNQWGVLIRVFEGERIFVRDNNLLAELKLDGIPPASQDDAADAAEPLINVCSEIPYPGGPGGTFIVSATDMSTGRSVSVDINALELRAGRRSTGATSSLARQGNDDAEIRHENSAPNSQSSGHGAVPEYCIPHSPTPAESPLKRRRLSRDAPPTAMLVSDSEPGSSNSFEAHAAANEPAPLHSSPSAAGARHPGEAQAATEDATAQQHAHARPPAASPPGAAHTAADALGTDADTVLNNKHEAHAAANEAAPLHASPSAASPSRPGEAQAATEAPTAQQHAPAPPPAARPPRAAHAAADALELLEDQLDEMHLNNLPLLGRYALGGRRDRRIGGRGVVQFAIALTCHTDPDAPEKYALKFFLNRSAFEAEKSHLLNPRLRQVMPRVVDIIGNEDGAVASLGRPLPPVVVSERAVSLAEWQRSRQPDFETAMQVVLQLVEHVVFMHKAGVVHRNLHPGNVIYYPDRNEVALINFSSAASIGSAVTINCKNQLRCP